MSGLKYVGKTLEGVFSTSDLEEKMIDDSKDLAIEMQ